MRAIWISITVFLLDQLTKYAIQLTHLDDSIHFVKGGLTLIVVQNSGITAAQFNATLLDSTSWILVCALFTIPLLISRWNSHLHFITFGTLLGLQLTVGAILSITFDYLLRGNIQSSVELRLFEAFSLKAGVADMALMAGFTLLIYALLSGATRIRSRLPLRRATPATLNFSPLSRGVDNIHIDVHLSPEFRRNATIVIKRLVDVVLSGVLKKRASHALSSVLFNNVKKAFVTLHQDALHKAKGSGEFQLVDLFYVSLLKFIHTEVNNCVVARIRQAKETIQDHHKRGHGGQHDSRYVEELFRQQDNIIAKVNQLMFDGMIDNQLANLKNGIKGFLGSDRSFAMDAMRAPLVTANRADIEAVQFNHYMLFGHGRYVTISFLEIDRVLDEQLHDYLALIAVDDSAEERSGRHKSDNSSNSAAILSRPSVLMHPANITILFDQQWAKDKIAKISRFKEWKKHYKYHAQRRFQQRLGERVEQALNKAGLARWIIAVYEARTLLNRVSSDAAPLSLVVLLLECENKKELQQRLAQLRGGAALQTLGNEIVSRWEAMRKPNNKLLQQHLLAFITDFSHYRRDLQLLYRYHNTSSEIELLQDEKSLQTSRSNFTLYEFLLPEEKSSELAEIRSHIIIKADLRGSTEITDRLVQLALNPATHFDRNFFSPINEVINTFGAEKVFIEGDAIILILNDYAGARQANLIASRACALASGILNVVAKQNKELLCYGLPELELGIGIAHCNESPRFLFDGDHKITISPAINRADRLSACTWSIRNWRSEQHAPASHVEVYQPSERMMGRGEKAQKELVYNLNGILIEPAVFEALQRELTPKRIVNSLESMQDSRLYAINVPGPSGKSNSLLIRKAPVRIYDPGHRYHECPSVEEHYYYEVIHDREILAALRKRPAQGAA